MLSTGHQVWVRAAKWGLQLPVRPATRAARRPSEAVRTTARVIWVILTPSMGLATSSSAALVGLGFFFCDRDVTVRVAALGQGCETGTSSACTTCNTANSSPEDGANSCACDFGFYDSNASNGNGDLSCAGVALLRPIGCSEVLQHSVKAARWGMLLPAVSAGVRTPPLGRAMPALALLASLTPTAAQETGTKHAPVSQRGFCCHRGCA